MKELKAKFGPEGLMVTAALSPNPKIIELAYDLPELNKYLDVFNVMAYDYYGAWDKATGHHSPLEHHPDSLNSNFSSVRPLCFCSRNFYLHFIWMQDMLLV